MNKNSANLFLFVARDSRGVGRVGLSPALKISKDGGSFSATTNSVSALDATNAPGCYQCQLTQTECNCDLLVIQCTFSTGDNPAVIGIYEMESGGGGATPQQIWEYSGGRTVTNTAEIANVVWNRQTGTSRTLTESPTDITSLATSSDLSAAVADIIGAIPDVSGLSTFNASTDTVALSSTQVNALVSGVLNASVSARDSGSLGSTVLAISGYTDSVESKIDTVSTMLEELPIVRALLDRWAVSGSTLMCYDSTGNVLESCTLTKDDNGDIIEVTPDVPQL